MSIRLIFIHVVIALFAQDLKFAISVWALALRQKIAKNPDPLINNHQQYH